MSVCILTDTNSGIKLNEAKELGIEIINMPIIIDGQTFYEGVDLNDDDFYSALASGKDVTTSMPSPGVVIDKWDEILKTYDELVYIPMSSGLSSSCATAKSLAEDYNGKVVVIDNHRISATLYVSILTAIKMANEGKTANDIREFLEADAYNSSIYIYLDTLEYLKKGGRITPAAAILGDTFRIKPILTIQGEKLDSFLKVMGSRERGRKKLLETIKSERETRFKDYSDEVLQLGVAGTYLDKEEIELLKEALRDLYPSATIYYAPLALSIGAHTGPKAFGYSISINW